MQHPCYPKIYTKWGLGNFKLLQSSDHWVQLPTSPSVLQTYLFPLISNCIYTPCHFMLLFYFGNTKTMINEVVYMYHLVLNPEAVVNTTPLVVEKERQGRL